MIAHESSAKSVSPDQFIHCDEICHVAEPGSWNRCAGWKCTCCGRKMEVLPTEQSESSGLDSPSGPGGDEITYPEEAKEFKAAVRPWLPSQAEIDKHRIDHLPYRIWCPECVEGFGRERAHHGHEGERSIPLVSCDYMFFTERGVFARHELPEEEKAQAVKVIVVKCASTGCLFAHVVPQKGVDPDGFVIEQLKQDIVWLGHSQVVIRSDNEPALVKVVEKTVGLLKIAGLTSATSEGSVPYDPQTNGRAESAVGVVKGMFRTLLLGFEKQIGGRMPLTHPVVSWLVAHAAAVRNLRVVGADGKTLQQRARGTSGVPTLLGFGELCRYKMRSQEKGIGVTAWRFSTGVWLGLERNTKQYAVYDKKLGGIRHARTIVPMPSPQQWSLERVQKVDVTPGAIHQGPPPLIVPQEVKPDEAAAPKTVQTRRLYIRQGDLDARGYTPKLPQVRPPRGAWERGDERPPL